MITKKKATAKTTSKSSAKRMKKTRGRKKTGRTLTKINRIIPTKIGRTNS